MKSIQERQQLSQIRGGGTMDTIAGILDQVGKIIMGSADSLTGQIKGMKSTSKQLTQATDVNAKLRAKGIDKQP